MERSDSSSLACTECRRKKSKCDRLKPQCDQCQKFQRSCTYARVSRTPLTRRHLTDVEGELAKAKRIIRELNAERGTRSSLADHRTSLSQSREPEANWPSFNDAPIDQSENPLSPLPQAENVVQQSPVGPNDPFAVSPTQGQIGTVSHRRNGTFSTNFSANQVETRPTPASANSLETPPASGDFDWDERTRKPGMQRFTDGMASLATKSSQAGYLGVASGAFLVRVTDAEPSEPPMGHGREEDQDNAFHNETAGPLRRSPAVSIAHLEPFIDSYFRLYHCSYPIVHEATLRAQFMEVIPRPSHPAWQVLIHVISSIGGFTAAESADNSDLALFDAAKSRLSVDMLETGNIILVQALTLMSNYLQKRNKPNSGYNYLGLARRIAMGIGLHKEFPTWRAKPLSLEMRRRTWWCLYIFDIGATITFSRPLDQPLGGIEVGLPLNVHDSDVTAATRQMPSEAHETTLYTHVRCQSTFHLATSHIYSRLITAPFPSAHELVQLDDEHISEWLTSLPRWFNDEAVQPPRYALCHAILQWRYRNFRILMYRPILLRRVMTRSRRPSLVKGLEPGPSGLDVEELAVQRCLDAAQQSVELIAQFWFSQRKTMLVSWYGLYFLFQAVLLPVICLRNDPRSVRATAWREQVKLAARVIEDMKHLNGAAPRCLEVIINLCGSFLAGSDDNWHSPIQESPQTQLTGIYPFMWPMMDTSQNEGPDILMQGNALTDFMNQMPDFV